MFLIFEEKTILADLQLLGRKYSYVSSPSPKSPNALGPTPTKSQ